MLVRVCWVKSTGSGGGGGGGVWASGRADKTWCWQRRSATAEKHPQPSSLEEKLGPLGRGASSYQAEAVEGGARLGDAEDEDENDAQDAVDDQAAVAKGHRRRQCGALGSAGRRLGSPGACLVCRLVSDTLVLSPKPPGMAPGGEGGGASGHGGGGTGGSESTESLPCSSARKAAVVPLAKRFPAPAILLPDVAADAGRRRCGSKAHDANTDLNRRLSHSGYSKYARVAAH